MREKGQQMHTIDSSHISAIKVREGRVAPKRRPCGHFIHGSIRHNFPSRGRQLTLCWRTSWESHPSEDLSELLSQKYHYRLTGSWRSSLPKLPWPEWVSLCTLYGRPLMQNTLHRWSSRTRPDAFLFGTVS